jgi:polysaccharide export outer membrane protein
MYPASYRRLRVLVVLLAALALPGRSALADSPVGPAAEYRIGAKDVLKVTVWGQEDLSRQVVVSADGTFAFPLIGDVQAAGLTPGELETRLRDLLGKDYLVNPQVSVSVHEYRSQRVFVLGEVEKAGTYTLTGRTTLLDVLSQAGGPGKSAGRQVAVVRFPRSEGPVVPGAAGSVTFRANLRRLLDGVAEENILLQNGDTVFVPKLTSFFVLGEVLRQGAYAMEKETTALEAVTLAGGFTDRAAPGGAKILRKRPDGAQDAIDVDLSDPRAREVQLAEGDTLLVPRGNTFFVSGEVRKPGAYQLEKSTTAFGAVTVAGGFTEKAGQSQAKLIRRLSSGQEQTLVLDLSGADPAARDLLLRDGDTLLIPSGNTFYVLGEVKKPGAYQLDQATTAIQAVAMAGGFTDKAAPNRTKVIRTHSDGRQETIVVDLNDVVKRGRKERDVPLIANDVIVVPESFF